MSAVVWLEVKNKPKSFSGGKMRILNLTSSLIYSRCGLTNIAVAWPQPWLDGAVNLELNSWYQCPLNHALWGYHWALIWHREFVLVQKMLLHSRLGIMCCICYRSYQIIFNGEPINNIFFGSGLFVRCLEQVHGPFSKDCGVSGCPYHAFVVLCPRRSQPAPGPWYLEMCFVRWCWAGCILIF